MKKLKSNMYAMAGDREMVIATIIGFESVWTVTHRDT